MRDLLTEYVDEQSPEEAPPFEYVEQAVRERRRRHRVIAGAVAAVVVVAGISAGIGVPRTMREPAAPDDAPTVPVHAALDEGAPPAQFRIGATWLVQRGEIAVTAVRVDPASPTIVIVTVARDDVAVEPCVPNTIVRILSQDNAAVRIAAYRYGVAPDQREGHQCNHRSVAPTTLQVELRRPLGYRTVYAGTKGFRTVLN
ncbi:hypothetical protein AB0E69_17740 [Kribbella sp. NPDC026611]|uniref:hypothetical protein n=1 Tax=Kribbella sp. NPDC026611 TaxID=3154911 RepID=UPI0033DB4BE2